MKKLFYLIVFLSTMFASAQGLEPKTYVGNGVVIGPKTTTEINALTVTPNGYIQVNETTGTIFLRIGGSWVNTGLASNISITDSGDNFTATDVEGALAELAASGGGAAYRNPEVLYVARTSGDVTNEWAEVSGQEGKKVINYCATGNCYYNVPSGLTTLQSILLNPIVNPGANMIFTSDNFTIRGNGTQYVSIGPNPTSGFVGVYVDSASAADFSRNNILTSHTFWRGYFKPYSISQVTGVASSNIDETSFDIDWNAATASVGTISNYQYSIDGGTPVDVTGATGATVSGLTASTTYNVNVRAVDAGGNKGQYSADLSVTTASSFTPLWAANAATPTPNEVAGFAGFIDASNYSVGTVTSPVTNGTNAISITRTADGNSSADIGLQFQNLTIGQSYDFTFSIQITSGSPNNNYVRTNGTYAADWSVTGLVEYGTGNVGNWETYTLTMTPAVTNPRMRFNSSALVGVNTNGMVTLFDNLIVTPN